MEAMIAEITDVKVESLHHDVGTGTGEEVVLYVERRAAVPRSQKEVNANAMDFCNKPVHAG